MKPTAHPFLFLLLGLVLPCAVPAAGSSVSVTVPSVVRDDAGLARALDGVREDSIRADLHFIASDELQGRDTPSQGQRLAARFLRARVQRLGFTAAGNDGFLATYEAQRIAMDNAACRATAAKGTEKRELAFGKDYYFFMAGAALDLQAPIVYVGKAAATELEGLSLGGKWALCHTSEEVGWRERRENVQASGAVGMLLLPGAHEDPADFARSAERMSRGGRARLRVSTAEFPASNLSPQLGEWMLPQGAQTAVGETLAVDWHEVRVLSADSEQYVLENVAALWPGRHPELKKEVIILSAHYDHVGARDGKVWNGADDNGSGTVGLLAVADALARYGPMERSVLLLWVSGEEKGLLGSAAWSKNPTLPEGYRPVLDLNIDMIGRNAPDHLMITPTKEHAAYNGLTRLAEKFAPVEGFAPLASADSFWGRSDHANFFANLGIPVAFLFTGIHEDYHEPTDTVEKIDYDKMRRVCRLVLRMLEGLQGEDLGV